MRPLSRYRSVCAIAGVLFGVSLAVCVPRASAAEVVVQNDSVVDFSKAVIVGGFIFGEEGGVPYYAMERVEGCTLAEAPLS